MLAARCGSLDALRLAGTVPPLLGKLRVLLLPLPLLQVGIRPEFLAHLVTFLLVAFLQDRLLCCLLGGDNAAHGIKYVALALPLAF